VSTLADYTAAVYDVRMTQGDSFIEELLMEDGEGEPLDLTGYTFRSQIRRTADNGLVAEFTISTDESTVTRSLLPAVTAGLEGTYVHDFQWTDPQGAIRTLLSGNFEIEAEVTR
jgi:DNA-binding NarL/FixJ family response regulator